MKNSYLLKKGKIHSIVLHRRKQRKYSFSFSVNPICLAVEYLREIGPCPQILCKGFPKIKNLILHQKNFKNIMYVVFSKFYGKISYPFYVLQCMNKFYRMKLLQLI